MTVQLLFFVRNNFLLLLALIVLIPHCKAVYFLLMPKTIYIKSKPSRDVFALWTETPFMSINWLSSRWVHRYNVCFINAVGIYKHLTLIESVSKIHFNNKVLYELLIEACIEQLFLPFRSDLIVEFWREAVATCAKPILNVN
jgi:hypothetical protein